MANMAQLAANSLLKTSPPPSGEEKYAALFVTLKEKVAAMEWAVEAFQGDKYFREKGRLYGYVLPKGDDWLVVLSRGDEGVVARVNTEQEAALLLDMAIGGSDE